MQVTKDFNEPVHRSIKAFYFKVNRKSHKVSVDFNFYFYNFLMSIFTIDPMLSDPKQNLPLLLLFSS